MKERPILFSGPMVRAILEGRKTQTRRVWKKQPYVSREPTPRFLDTAVGDLFICPDIFPTGDGPAGCVITECESVGTYHSMGKQQFIEKHGPKAYGVPGDRLWVRETWRPTKGSTTRNRFAADCDELGLRERKQLGLKWKPSIFMPRHVSRITLEIADVRVQRLQEISEEDAQAEGIEPIQGGTHLWRNYGLSKSEPDWFQSTYHSFRSLWDSINAKRGFGWDVNPWVWAITFKQITT